MPPKKNIKKKEKNSSKHNSDTSDTETPQTTKQSSQVQPVNTSLEVSSVADQVQTGNIEYYKYPLCFNIYKPTGK